MAIPDPPQALLPAPEEPKLLPAPPAPAPAPAASGWRRHPRAVTGMALAVFVLIAFGLGWFLHHRRSSAAEDRTRAERDAIPLVTVVAATRSPDIAKLLLPGSLSPLTEASLYARASGYVRHRYVDLGDAVKKGQLLAEIDSPELDQQVAQGLAATAQARQQLNQARAAVGDAQARLDLARVTVQRYETLLQQDSAARQDVDQRRQEYASAAAMKVSAEANVGAAAEFVRAAEANQRRLVALQQFEKLRAPFDGIITARNVDEGALISNAGASLVGGSASPLGSGGSSGSGSGSTGSSGSSSALGGGDSGSGSSGGGSASSGGSGAELFRIAQIDRLRVYVGVPQESAGAVQIGAAADVLLQEFEAPIPGRVTRTAGAIDPASRTLLAEVQIDNARHLLMPGMYGQVRFTSARSNPPLLVPGETLMARADGMRVAVVRPLGDAQREKIADPADARCARQIRLQPVTLGRDYGTQVEVTRGLQNGDLLALNPGDDATDSAVVLPQLQPDGGKDAAGSGNGAGQRAGRGASAASDGGGGSGASAASAGGEARKDDAKGGKPSADEDAQRRARARATCAEDEVHAAATAASAPRPAPAGQEAEASPASAAGTTGGPSDERPGGIQSPSMAAPTQGRGSGRGKKP